MFEAEFISSLTVGLEANKHAACSASVPLQFLPLTTPPPLGLNNFRDCCSLNCYDQYGEDEPLHLAS